MNWRRVVPVSLAFLVLVVGASSQVSSATGIDLNGKDLEDSGTTIWDASASHIPSSVVEATGLNADTLDGYNTSQLTWSVLGISQSDVSASDVGLGSVQNEAQVAEGGDTMSGQLDINHGGASTPSLVVDGVIRDSAGNCCQIDLNDGVWKAGTDIDITSDQDGGSGGPYTWTIKESNGALDGNDLKIEGTNVNFLHLTDGNGDAALHSGSNVDLVSDTDGSSGGPYECTLGTTDGSWSCPGSKNWIHQLNSTHEAVYSSQESPQVRAVFEGKAHVVDSKKIKLPSHFTKTVSNTKPMLRAQVTPQGTLTDAAVMEKTDDYIKIKVGKETDVNFRITGIREGYEDKQVVRRKQ